MPVINPSAATVQVNLPVPTPVPQRPKAPPQPVPGAAKPTLAPVPQGMEPQGPVARAFLLPWRAAPKRMRRAGVPIRKGLGDREAFEQAIDRDPTNPMTHLVYADYLQENGEEDEAAFRRAMGEWVQKTSTPNSGLKPNMTGGEGGDYWLAHYKVLPQGVKGLFITGDTSTPPDTEPTQAMVIGPWFRWQTYRGMEDAFRRAFMANRRPQQMRRPTEAALPRRQLRREGEPVQYASPASGKYGTPEWNPPPHPDADPDRVANRANDPLWGYHRYQVGYSGVPIENMTDRAMGKPNGYLPVLHSQLEPQDPFIPGSFFHHRYGPLAVDHTSTLPEGFTTADHARSRWTEDRDAADLILTSRMLNRNNIDRDHPDGMSGILSPMRQENRPRYENLWGRTGTGRRPWFNTVFALQELENYAAPHDPYRLLATAVLSGNRHALPPLVDLLKRRDNPAGWYRLWPTLAKAMADRVGDLPPEDVLRRVSQIGEHTAGMSRNPDEHYAISDRARHTGDLTGYAVLADHMDENGLPQYAQLLRAELANVMPQMRHPTKGRSRLSRLPRRRLTRQCPASS